MPGMTPRQKAKVGRLDLPGFKGSNPTLTITFPVNGAVVTGSPAVAFTATAIDKVDGDISASIEWFVGAIGSPEVVAGTGASADLSASLAGGANTVTARVTDSANNLRLASISVTN